MDETKIWNFPQIFPCVWCSVSSCCSLLSCRFLTGLHNIRQLRGVRVGGLLQFLEASVDHEGQANFSRTLGLGLSCRKAVVCQAFVVVHQLERKIKFLLWWNWNIIQNQNESITNLLDPIVFLFLPSNFEMTRNKNGIRMFFYDWPYSQTRLALGVGQDFNQLI